MLDNEAYKSLELMLNNIHEQGVVNLELISSNVVVEDLSRKPYLIDLGSVLFKGKETDLLFGLVAGRKFQEMKDQDFRALESLFM